MNDTYLGFSSLMVIGISIALWIRAWVVAAALGVAALVGGPGWLGGVPAGLGVLASVFFLATVVIGGQKVGDGAIHVGASLPHFTATDENGEVFDSQSLAGHPVLIKFFRGHW